MTMAWEPVRGRNRDTKQSTIMLFLETTIKKTCTVDRFVHNEVETCNGVEDVNVL